MDAPRTSLLSPVQNIFRQSFLFHLTIERFLKGPPIVETTRRVPIDDFFSGYKHPTTTLTLAAGMAKRYLFSRALAGFLRIQRRGVDTTVKAGRAP